MNKMIKVSPALASIIGSIRKLQNNTGRTQASRLTANGAKFVIRDPRFLRILESFRKAPNQVGYSPLLLRSAYSANYSEVQALKDRIAKLINEKKYLKGQYDQQKEQDKAFYNNLQAQYNNLNIQYGNLQNRNGVLTNQITNLQNQVNQLGQKIQSIKNYVSNFRTIANNFVGNNVNGNVKRVQAVEMFNWVANA